jgi:hypothetical protein
MTIDAAYSGLPVEHGFQTYTLTAPSNSAPTITLTAITTVCQGQQCVTAFCCWELRLEVSKNWRCMASPLSATGSYDETPVASPARDRVEESNRVG